jgi:arabinofuranosyltransferase
MTNSHSRPVEQTNALIIFLFAVYSGIFIFQSAVNISGERYFTLFEDAMISMRYAKNLAHGHGLVWNPGGEHVEGFTNFLWTIFMSLFHLLPTPESKMSLLIQIAGAFLLFLNLIYTKRIAFIISNGSRLITSCAVFLTAFYFPLNYWGLLGMEVSALVLLTSMCIWKSLQNKKTVQLEIYLLLMIGVLIRLDMVLIFIFFLIFHFFNTPDLHERKKNLLIGLGVLSISIGSQTIFRIWYFGDPLPNTYYLKMTGYPVMWRIIRGLATALNFAIKNWWVFLLAFMAAYRRRDQSTVLLAGIFFVQLCYSIYVGGDAWEEGGGSNRFVSVAMPGVFLLYSLGAEHLQFQKGWKLFAPQSAGRRILILTIVGALGLNALRGPDSWYEWLLIRHPEHGAPQKQMVELAMACKNVTTDSARAATALSGIFPYFFGRSVIDLLGKNDRVIAHQKARTDILHPGILTFYPGHMKWDYRYGIETQQPDIVANLWSGAEVIKDYLSRNYIKVKVGDSSFFAKKTSPNILWDKVKNH